MQEVTGDHWVMVGAWFFLWKAQNMLPHPRVETPVCPLLVFVETLLESDQLRMWPCMIAALRAK